jgi:hypothetical protein
MGGNPASGVDHGNLADFPGGIGRQQGIEGLSGGFSGAHQLEPERAVRRVDEGLCGDGSHARFGPGDQAPDGKPVRLDRHAQCAGNGVPRNDRVGMNRPLLLLGAGRLVRAGGQNKRSQERCRKNTAF